MYDRKISQALLSNLLDGYNNEFDLDLTECDEL